MLLWLDSDQDLAPFEFIGCFSYVNWDKTVNTDLWILCEKNERS